MARRGEQVPEVSLTGLLETLKREKTRVLRIAGGVFLAAILVAIVLPTKYSSQASFIPPSNSSSSSASALVGQLSALGGGGLLGGAKGSGELYAGILKSRSIADELIARFNLKEVYGAKRDSDAVKRLASNTAIEVGQKDSIVTITVKDKSPERARDLANAYLDALHRANGRLALTESSQRRLFFGQQLAKEKDDLADAEVELKKVEEQSGLISPPGQTALQIETIAKTKAQIAVRQVELAALRQSSTEQNPEVILLHSEIADLEGQLTHLQNGSDRKEFGAIPAAKVPELQLTYVRKAREVKYHETLFDLLAKQFEAARMDEARDAPLLQVLDSASYPDVKSSPSRTLIALGGLVFGLLVGCGWVLGREYMQPANSVFASADSMLKKSAS